LVGQDGDPLPKLYVGESEDVKTRLNSHYSNLDFWQQAIVFTTRGTPLNKAQVKYLEARILELAKNAGRARLQNNTEPRRPRLTEADKAEMEGYLDELLSLCPILGVPFFDLDEASNGKVYYLKAGGCSAQGLDANTGFAVLKGSLACAEVAKSMEQYVPHYFRQRQDIIGDGILQKITGGYSFTKDYHFGSPSAAAAVCMGRSANGLIEWKDEFGTTLKDNREKATAEES
jgi:hypothetical protein